MRIGFVYDMRDEYRAEGYSETDVAEFDMPATIDAIAGTLAGLGHAVERIGHGRNLCRRLVAGERWDIVFSIAEGMHGRSREAQVPALLELFGQPYVFSDPLTCATTLDKAVAKRLVRDAGLHTPAFAVVHTPTDIAGINLPFPLFAKPLAEGTGKGVSNLSRIGNRADLRKACETLLQQYRQPVLVETYLPGREFTTGVLGTGSRARVLGTMEVRVRDDAPAVDYTYQVKEECDTYVIYSRLADGPLRVAVEELALQSYRTLDCRDGGRVDIRLDPEGKPAFMEVNPLPGLHPQHSDLPMIATQEGCTFPSLLEQILASALERYTISPAPSA